MEYLQLKDESKEEIEKLCASGRLYQQWECIAFDDEGKAYKRIDYQQIKPFDGDTKYFFAQFCGLGIIKGVMDAGLLYKSVDALSGK